MKTSDFDYPLPRELIAQEPAYPRDSCRLMVLRRDSGQVSHKHFSDILDHINPGDLLVANETRVLPARLIGNKVPTGGVCELLLLHPCPDDTWECLARPGKRLKPGARMEFRSRPVTNPKDEGADPFPQAQGLDEENAGQEGPVSLRAEVVSICGDEGARIVRLEPVGCSLDEAIHSCGAVPLPPYITGYSGNMEMYQTVYSRQERSAAAPTAGLHFTSELIESVLDKGAFWETVELEVGLDTFRTVAEEDPADHKMHTERYSVPQRVIDAVERTKRGAGRVIAVGTTSVRSLESAWDERMERMVARQDEATSLFIRPGYEFHVIDAMITNFHVPRSTLMMLVSAFAGHENIMRAYDQAIERRYRMLSFGDAMLIE